MDLAVEALACRRAGRLVFRDLGFHVGAGEAVALRGPNGVGKSTLLRLLAGFLRPAGGDARLDGVSLAREAQGFQERVAYAGHLDAVKPALGVSENLALWAALHGAPEGRVRAALARFGLEHIAGRPAGECSAGQTRRLGLARLLLVERPLWLLDEPTVSLDAESVALVAELVREHVHRGGLALVATHLDLGLGAIREIRMTPPAADAAPPEGAAADPFLEGAW